MKIPSTITRLFLLLGLLALRLEAHSQAASTQLASSLEAVQRQYDKVFVGHPQLYNGPEYVDYAQRYRKRVDHQFFLSPDRQPGSVYYNDHLFTDLKLGYDEVLDQIVLQHATSPITMRLINDNVRYFIIEDHHFIRLVPDSAAATVISTGYYEVLVDSTVQLLAKRTKKMEEKIEQTIVTAVFSPADKLFIRKAGVYYPVNKKRSVTQLFADRGKEVQKYIQDNKLKFKKKRREADIVRLTRYYASLAPQ